MVTEERVDEWARLLIEECVGVQPGWQVLLIGQPLARPLVEACARRVARREAYALVRYRFEQSANAAWLKEAPAELTGTTAPITAHEYEAASAYVAIVAPDNTRDLSDVPGERIASYLSAMRALTEPYLADEKPWVGTYWPTEALAQDAGMTLRQLEAFVLGAVLVDWQALAKDMERIAARFDAADEVRIVGAGTDIRFSLAGRTGLVDALGANLPGGEVFYSPVEDSAEGVIEFGEFPACYQGHQVGGVRLRFESGQVVDASAASDEAFLLAQLDADGGARRLGEFGIGCNPGIQRHIRNTLFDEKIAGTVHLAVGHGFPNLGGTNVSAVHWDMVKDLRRGGRIELDGQVVQEDGRWL